MSKGKGPERINTKYGEKRKWVEIIDGYDLLKEGGEGVELLQIGRAKKPKVNRRKETESKNTTA